MKKILPFLLLSPFLTLQTKQDSQGITKQAQPSFASFPFLEILDGSIMNAIEFQKLLKTWNDINDIQYKRTYALSDSNETITLKDLVLREHTHATTKKDETNKIEQTHHTCKLLTKTLQAIKQDYLVSTKPSEEDEKKQKAHIDTFHKIVESYLAHIKKPDSVVRFLHEDSLDHKIETMNVREFFTFLNEVKGLLKNIMYTCVKARESYKKQCIKAEDAKTFDAFFEKP